MYVEAERKNTCCPTISYHFTCNLYLCHMTIKSFLNNIVRIRSFSIIIFHINNWLCFILIEWEAIEANLRTEVVEIVGLTCLYIKGIGDRWVCENRPAHRTISLTCSCIWNKICTEVTFVNIVLKCLCCHVKCCRYALEVTSHILYS